MNGFDRRCLQIAFEPCGMLAWTFSALEIVRANREPKAGPAVSAPKSSLPSSLFQTGKGDGWNGPTCDGSTQSIPLMDQAHLLPKRQYFIEALS